MPETAGDGHVDIAFANGFRLMFDSEDVVRSLWPEWVRDTGNQLALAFQCDGPAEVDEIYRRMTAEGFAGEKEP